MGLPKPALRFLAREHRRKPFEGPVLTLGRQNVYATFDEIKRLLISEQITPATLPAGTDLKTNVPNWVGVPYKNATSDLVFFKSLGINDVQALDYSDFESAEVVHDLNQPVSKNLISRYGLVLDSGTIEHVFDVRQVMMNIALMLKPGGRVIHITPANNYVNHGFFQFSPTLFFDYYAINGFADMRGFLVEHHTYLSESKPWDVYELTTDVEHLTSVKSLLVVFVAEKTAESTADKIPLQSSYRRIYESGAAAKDDRKAQYIKKILPHRAKAFLKKNVPGMGTMKKPWGLKRSARLK